MIRFASLGSGSKGNATLIQSGDTLVLVDCGYSAVETARRMAALEVSPDALTAVLVTHEHGDHIKGVPVLSRKYRLPVYLTHGTARGCRDTRFHQTRFISPHNSFDLGNLRVSPFPVPHDAEEPCQFVFSDPHDQRLGLLTDAGCITSHMIAALDGCHALLLECNYDPQMLANGPYPPPLQRRIDHRYGHLANHQARELLASLDTANLSYLRAMHLSEKNNDENLVLDMLCSVVDTIKCDVRVANQQRGFGWVELAAP